MKRYRPASELQRSPSFSGKQWRLALLLSYALLLQAWIGTYTHARHALPYATAYCVTSTTAGRSGFGLGNQQEQPTHDPSAFCCVIGCAHGGANPAMSVTDAMTLAAPASTPVLVSDTERLTRAGRLFVGLARGPPAA